MKHGWQGLREVPLVITEKKFKTVLSVRSPLMLPKISSVSRKRRNCIQRGLKLIKHISWLWVVFNLMARTDVVTVLTWERTHNNAMRNICAQWKGDNWIGSKIKELIDQIYSWSSFERLLLKAYIFFWEKFSICFLKKSWRDASLLTHRFDF